MAFGNSSKRIAGITIEIGADTTKLTDALKGFDKQLDTSKSNLKDIDKLLKLNPGNVTLLTQKQKELESSIGKTKERLAELKNVQKDSVSPEDWDKIQREIIETENQLESLEKEYKNFGSVAAQQVIAVGEKMQTVGSKISDVGKTLTDKITKPIVDGFGKALSSFAEVDKTMQLTNKTMGNTAEEAETLNAAMKEAAANSVYGMSDAATATLNFARAGLDAEEAAAALAPAMNLAAGEGGDLDTVSSGLVATINGFHGSFDEAATYADVFAAACNNSALDVNSLSEAMSIAAPTFAAGGYAVKDAALYLGIMANAGVDANKAANSLKTGFMRLVSPPKEAAIALDELGVSVVNADGSMKDTLVIQKDLNKAFKQLSESEQLAAASAIFGKNQAAPWLALINTATPDVEKLNAAIQNSAGTTDEMAEAMMGGFGGAIEQLKSSLDVLIYSIGEQLAPYALKVVGIVQKCTNWLNKLSPKTKKIAVLIGSVAAAIGPLLVGVGGFVTLAGKGVAAFGSLMKFLPAIKGGLTAIAGVLTGPVGIVAGVAAVIAIVLKATGAWDKIKASLIDAWPKIQKGAVDAWEAIKTKFGEFKAYLQTNLIEPLKALYDRSVKPVFDRIAEAFEPVKKSAEATWNVIKGIFSGWNSFGDLKIMLGDLWNELKKFGGKLGKILSETDWAAIGSEAWELVKSAFAPAAEWLKGVFESGMELVKGIDWAAVGNAVWDGVKAVGGWFGNLFSNAWSFITNSIDWAAIGNAVWDGVKAIGGWLLGLFQSTLDLIGLVDWGRVGTAVWDGVKAVGGWLFNLFSNAWSYITTSIDWPAVGTAVWNGVKAVGEWLGGLFSDAWEAIKNIDWAAVGTAVWDGVKAIGGWLGNLFSNAWNYVKSSIDWPAIGNAIWEGLKAIGGWLSGLFSTAWEEIKTIDWAAVGTAIWEGFRSVGVWLTNRFSDALEAIKNIDWATVGSTIKTKIGDLGNWLKGRFEAAKTAIEQIDWPTVGSKIKTKIGDLGEWLKGRFQAAKNGIVNIDWKGIGSRILTKIKNGLSELKDWFAGLFDLSNVHIPLPHLSWSHDYSLSDPFNLPTPEVKWYSKAYDNPVMFTRPTVVSTPSGPKGFGDGNGGEVVLSEARLRQMAGGGTVNNNITINQLPGESSEQLAARVQRVLVRWDQQKKAAYGR